jgi:hypothetical protein
MFHGRKFFLLLIMTINGHDHSKNVVVSVQHLQSRSPTETNDNGHKHTSLTMLEAEFNLVNGSQIELKVSIEQKQKALEQKEQDMAQLVAKVQDEIAQLGVQLKLLLSATKNK